MSTSFPVFVLQRLLAVVFVSVAAATLAFLCLHGLFPETFNDTHPLLVELVLFLKQTFIDLDLGQSTVPPFGRVAEIVGSGLEADISVIAGALAFGFGLGILAGAVAARRPRSLVARAIDVAGLITICMPVYLTCMVAIFLFAPSIAAPIPLPFTDPHSYVPIQHDPLQWAGSLIVPWIAAGLPLAAINMRLTRADLEDVLDADYVRTANAKGLPPWAVMGRHLLPVAMPPAISLTGSYVPLLIGNAFLVEAVYEIPGSVQLMPHAIQFGNYALIQALVIVSAVFVVVCNGVADVLLALLDPRIRSGR
ncbi:MAG: peptide/nickel transport system permease protein [Solirubrobacteraceae bacterium]|nr:peptide/nickel transport system permease protein [Solirubrobacteraceae bacterium]